MEVIVVDFCCTLECKAVCVCACVYVCVCARVCVYVHVYVCVCIYECVRCLASCSESCFMDGSNQLFLLPSFGAITLFPPSLDFTLPFCV